MKMIFNKRRFVFLILAGTFLYSANVQLCKCNSCHHISSSKSETRSAHLFENRCCSIDSVEASLISDCNCSHINVYADRSVSQREGKTFHHTWNICSNVYAEAAGDHIRDSSEPILKRAPPWFNSQIYLRVQRFIC